MKNKLIKSGAELQKHVDYIIELSDIIDHSENRAKKEESCHLNVDVILAEPLYVSKRHKEKRLPHVHSVHPKKEVVDEFSIKPFIPKREKLIVHGEVSLRKNKIAVVDVIYSLLKPLSYQTK